MSDKKVELKTVMRLESQPSMILMHGNKMIFGDKVFDINS